MPYLDETLHWARPGGSKPAFDENGELISSETGDDVLRARVARSEEHRIAIEDRVLYRP